ncbi:MAG TPA: hypothetical protein DEB30_00480 [Candidatus Peribacter riflensis]|uniref:Uncharacterized protein n=1 Tax=Candidatus Peribacter riflensis TaxID=1735162 RepID=A0A0S1SQH5_9BACT|nr:MAG: hypothetical protein PeribacterA2_1003 [Candidatus Peribacter riflensis]OGJ78451.1 MAG: hypothetical protein A2398_02285 [Candidatus Peribacteria bacterium RIFOXYB1_FULL_57_12]OGJ82109.1 MAG: hypothetical protein A2412_00055 [Candidatus Peribacteria bacterium RIFOXYC1_FULL_58_8]ALM11465.1 MAG: hypothetical protein PeribacterB2_1005 [Candidatus Peribacter riflensis]ALM12567.1 MAG: hypothetical protein PeribacterC2_1004 [Candidatus Peribacter riflensis]
MIRFRSLLWPCLLLLLALPAPGWSQQTAQADIASCRSLVESALSKEQRLYRSVLFGHTKAEDAPPSEVRFDTEGRPWIKTERNTWRSVSPRFVDVIWRDPVMDENDELQQRKGIYETRRVATSDLVPHLTQAYRALKCRSTIICKTVELSIGQESADPQEVTVTVPGCIEERRQTFSGCHLAAAEGNKIEEADVLTHCRLVRDDLVTRERDLLKLTTEYDAAYRSLLQLSGQTDAFLQEFRWPMINSLRKAAELVGTLHRIPCFIASCDEGPLPSSEE